MTFGEGYGSGYDVMGSVSESSTKARKKPYFKKQPQFFMPLTKAITVKFKIPIFWANKLDIELDLPVYYDVIYEKRMNVYSIREQKISLNTTKTEIIKAKINLFRESIQNISLKPDFRLQKMKNLSRLRKLLNNMEKVD